MILNPDQTGSSDTEPDLKPIQTTLRQNWTEFTDIESKQNQFGKVGTGNKTVQTKMELKLNLLWQLIYERLTGWKQFELKFKHFKHAAQKLKNL